MNPNVETAKDKAAPCPPPASMEITPAEFDYYMKRAQEMRAETVALFLDRFFGAIGRGFARAGSALRRRAPVRANQAETRAA